MTLEQLLTDLRTRAKALNQSEIARRAGVSRDTVRRFVNSEAIATDTLVKIERQITALEGEQ